MCESDEHNLSAPACVFLDHKSFVLIFQSSLYFNMFIRIATKIVSIEMTDHNNVNYFV